nr:hypothetical protein [uncultured Roseateles sp.]
MKNSAARKYINAHTIRRANQHLMTRGRDDVPSPLVQALMPSREEIVKAANNAFERWLAKAKVIDRGLSR